MAYSSDRWGVADKFTVSWLQSDNLELPSSVWVLCSITAVRTISFNCKLNSKSLTLQSQNISFFLSYVKFIIFGSFWLLSLIRNCATNGCHCVVGHGLHHAGRADAPARFGCVVVWCEINKMPINDDLWSRSVLFTPHYNTPKPRCVHPPCTALQTTPHHNMQNKTRVKWNY